VLTSYEHVLVRSSDELHGLLGEESHVLINGIICDVRVGAVVQGDEDV